MVEFSATIMKFGQQGEKTGWSYISIPAGIAARLNPGSKKTFRIKGRLDNVPVEKLAVLPMGNGDFILPINGTMRKALKKQKGATLKVRMEKDDAPPVVDADFLECLSDDPQAHEFFNELPQGHRNYFSKWISSAKTEATRTKRIALAVNALSKGWGFPQMLRAQKQDRELL